MSSAIPAALAAMRARFGTTITYRGTSYAASVASIGDDSPDYIPAGPGANSLFTDERVFSVAPSDFGTRPVPGDTLTWDSATYTVLGVRSIIYMGSPVAWRIVAYRSTAPQATTNDATQLAKWQVAA